MSALEKSCPPRVPKGIESTVCIDILHGPTTLPLSLSHHMLLSYLVSAWGVSQGSGIFCLDVAIATSTRPFDTVRDHRSL